jgi:DNA (cytosine-5)-methyltransferase 1
MPSDGTIRVFDMFCGGGGSSCGALMAGCQPVGGLDMWSLAADTYKLNFQDAKTYRVKANALPARRILEEVGPIQLLLASPECTSHSVAKGRTRGCEKSRETAFEVIRFARVLRPRWIVVENVPQMRHWRRYKQWLRELQRLGYNTEVGVLDAQHYATPQSRARLFVVCDLEVQPALPLRLSQERIPAGSILGAGESKKAPWSFKAVDLPGRAAATVERAERAAAALGKGQPFIMVYYGSDGAGGFQKLDRPLRTVTTLDRFAYVRPNCSGYEMRMLQPSELAAAMGFPRSHKWPDTNRRNRIRLIGNAVCPPVMREVIRTLMNSGGCETR